MRVCVEAGWSKEGNHGAKHQKRGSETFVAVAGVLQNGELRQCNVAVEISEGFWQFLIVRCGCSLCRYLPNSVPTHCNKYQQWLQNLRKIHPKTTRNRPKWCLASSQIVSTSSQFRYFWCGSSRNHRLGHVFDIHRFSKYSF